jgi:hypothetical protein
VCEMLPREKLSYRSTLPVLRRELKLDGGERATQVLGVLNKLEAETLQPGEPFDASVIWQDPIVLRMFTVATAVAFNEKNELDAVLRSQLDTLQRVALAVGFVYFAAATDGFLKLRTVACAIRALRNTLDVDETFKMLLLLRPSTSTGASTSALRKTSVAVLACLTSFRLMWKSRADVVDAFRAAALNDVKAMLVATQTHRDFSVPLQRLEACIMGLGPGASDEANPLRELRQCRVSGSNYHDGKRWIQQEQEATFVPMELSNSSSSSSSSAPCDMGRIFPNTGTLPYYKDGEWHVLQTNNARIQYLHALLSQ